MSYLLLLVHFLCWSGLIHIRRLSSSARSPPLHTTNAHVKRLRGPKSLQNESWCLQSQKTGSLILPRNEKQLRIKLPRLTYLESLTKKPSNSSFEARFDIFSSVSVSSSSDSKWQDCLQLSGHPAYVPVFHSWSEARGSGYPWEANNHSTLPPWDHLSHIVGGMESVNKSKPRNWICGSCSEARGKPYALVTKFSTIVIMKLSCLSRQPACASYMIIQICNNDTKRLSR